MGGLEPFVADGLEGVDDGVGEAEVEVLGGGVGADDGFDSCGFGGPESVFRVFEGPDFVGVEVGEFEGLEVEVGCGFGAGYEVAGDAVLEVMAEVEGGEVARYPVEVGAGDDEFGEGGVFEQVDDAGAGFVLEDVEVDGAEFLVDFFFGLGEVGEPLEEFCGLFFDLVGAASDDILPDVGGVFEVVLGEHLLPGFDLGGFGVEDESIEVEEEGFDQGVRVPLWWCGLGRMEVQPTLLVSLPVPYELGFEC